MKRFIGLLSYSCVLCSCEDNADHIHLYCQRVEIFHMIFQENSVLPAPEPAQVTFSSLKSPQSLSPSQAQCSGIHLPVKHWNWPVEQVRAHSSSSLPSPQSSSTHIGGNKRTKTGIGTEYWHGVQSLSITSKILLDLTLCYPLAQKRGKNGEGWSDRINRFKCWISFLL